MSITKLEAKNVLANIEFAKEWANGNTKCQVRDESNRWVNCSGFSALNFSKSPDQFRIAKDYFFERYVVTWTDAKGVLNERIFKGAKHFAEEFASKKRTYGTFRDTKLHTIKVQLDV